MKPVISSEAASHLLEQIHDLMKLQGENPFKIRAFEKAATAISAQKDLEARIQAGTLTEIQGIGKGISEVLYEFFKTGQSTVLNELQKNLPEGLLDLAQIQGLGPKKARQLIDELGIRTVRELEYACKENRLLKVKGFGEQAQAKILSAIDFMNKNEGLRRLGDAYFEAEELKSKLSKELKTRVSVVGEVARRCEVVSEISFLIEANEDEQKKIATHAKTLLKETKIAKVFFADKNNFGSESVRLTSSLEHWKAIGSPAKKNAADETSFYKSIGLNEIAPEFRESGEEVAMARENKLGEILPLDGIQGVFHNHTNYSDGRSTLEEMILGARDRGYKYIGISDHSQSAFYANGLKADRLKTQEKEIRALQNQYPEIRIFWGIECDILQDGSLDYPDAVLKKFDFVIASVHQRFKLDKDAMTERLVNAIRHPSVKFVGHLTGRLLLDRAAYDLDFEKVIHAAAEQDVAIELNANPQRLDIDWRYGGLLRKAETKISVNPDAHAVEGLDDTFFGIAMARKALMPSRLVINSWNVKEVEKWLN